jgi:hypothetical protein
MTPETSAIDDDTYTYFNTFVKAFKYHILNHPFNDCEDNNLAITKYLDLTIKFAKFKDTIIQKKHPKL